MSSSFIRSPCLRHTISDVCNVMHPFFFCISTILSSIYLRRWRVSSLRTLKRSTLIKDFYSKMFFAGCLGCILSFYSYTRTSVIFSFRNFPITVYHYVFSILVPFIMNAETRRHKYVPKCAQLIFQLLFSSFRCIITIFNCRFVKMN